MPPPPRQLRAGGAMKEGLPKRSVLLVSSASPATDSSAFLYFHQVTRGNELGKVPLLPFLHSLLQKKNNLVM